jgi:prepilin-type N-terminal cleavage/methylation domain-containing protein
MSLHHPLRIRSKGRPAGGYTLIEFMIVVALIATATLAVLGYKSLAKDDSDTASETQNVAVLVTKMPKLKVSGSYGKAGEDLLKPLVALGGIPTTMSVSGDTVTNAWGGAVTIRSTGAGYTLEYKKIPQSACISMAIGIAAGSASVSTKINGGTPITGAVTATAATAGCTGAENSLAWTYAS